MLREVGGSQIGEEKEASAPVNSCRPYGGQPVQNVPPMYPRSVKYL